MFEEKERDKKNANKNKNKKINQREKKKRLISKITLLKNIISKISQVLKTFVVSIVTSAGALNVRSKCP